MSSIEHVSGAHLLHALTIMAPLATLIVVTGAVRLRLAAALVAAGLATTTATYWLTRVIESSGHAELVNGAPLPFARVRWDAAAFAEAPDTLWLPANLAGDAAFWCCALILIVAAGQRLLSPAAPANRIAPREPMTC